MRMVVTFTEGDGYTYSCDVVRPIVYESAEAFVVGFEEALKLARKQKEYQFEFAGHDWATSMFYDDCTGLVYTLPNVLTVDEWFDNQE